MNVPRFRITLYHPIKGFDSEIVVRGDNDNVWSQALAYDYAKNVLGADAHGKLGTRGLWAHVTKLRNGR